jgi:hypothetical protein
VAFLLILPTPAIAGKEENIISCIKAVEAHSEKIVDRFSVNYTRKFIGHSIADWRGVKCEVSFGKVENLTVGDQQYISDGFAGREAKLLYDQIEAEIKKAKSSLESRLKELEKGLEHAEKELKKPHPQLNKIADYISGVISVAIAN